MTTLYDYIFGEDEQAPPPPPPPAPPAPSTGAGSTLPDHHGPHPPSPPSTGPVAGPEGSPTPPGAVPDAGRDVEEITEPCTRFQGNIIEITSIVNTVDVTVAGSIVSAPYWTLGPPSYEDGMNSTHPAAVPTEAGSDLEMSVKIDVTSADGLSGEAELIGTLSDGTMIELKGTFPVTVGEHSVTVKLDTATTKLARHRGNISWEARVPGCGRHIVGRTRVEIYRIIRDQSETFLSAGRPAEALRFIYENMSVAGTDVATSIAASDLTVTSSITTFLHGGHGLTYDTREGATFYLGGTIASATFFLLDYIAKDKGSTVNCYDQASGVLVCGAIIGVAGYTRFVGEKRGAPANATFGYINTTTLVGGIVSNNPFYRGIGTNPVETVLARRSPFGNHQFYINTASNVIFDACAGPHLGTEDYLTYMNVSVETSLVTPTYPTPAAWRAAWIVDDGHINITSIA